MSLKELTSRFDNHMKTYKSAFVSTLGVLFIAGCLSESKAAATLSGHVTDFATTVGIPAVTVEFFDRSGALLFRTPTDASGYYEQGNLPMETITAQYSKGDYVWGLSLKPCLETLGHWTLAF